MLQLTPWRGNGVIRRVLIDSRRHLGYQLLAQLNCEVRPLLFPTFSDYRRQCVDRRPTAV